jgi:hypothetical protein
VTIETLNALIEKYGAEATLAAVLETERRLRDRAAVSRGKAQIALSFGPPGAPYPECEHVLTVGGCGCKGETP